MRKGGGVAGSAGWGDNKNWRGAGGQHITTMMLRGEGGDWPMD